MANGIPSLLNNIARVTNTVSLLSSDLDIFFGAFQYSWGIYLAGTNVKAIEADSFNAMEYKKEYRVSDYPIELGTFTQYNKVALPYMATVRMIVGSSSAARSNFINKLESLAASVDLYDIITPEHVYLNANIVDYNYQRTSSEGAGMIIADIKLMEIRNTASISSFSNTQSPDNTSPANTGQTSPVDVPSPQSVLLIRSL